MDIRKSAVDLDASERDRFLEALIRLKHNQAPDAPSGVSVFDQFVALHGAVMAVTVPEAQDIVNFAHWNIGFCPWHRQYLKEFEMALQMEVAEVTIPYWDWTDHVDAINKLFTPDFLSSLNAGLPQPISDGFLRSIVPQAEQPSWWPSGAIGFRIHQLLEEGLGTELTRGNLDTGWPPNTSQIELLERLVIQSSEVHPFWYFWLVLETGHTAVTTRTHNAAHNFVGGHMGRAFSPNDPIFWLHHANVDRIWANWQSNRLESQPDTTPDDHWPNPTEPSPIDGRLAPHGHKLNDAMWPWIGNVPGYDTEGVTPEVKSMLPDYSDRDPVNVRDVLDVEPMGYRYNPPSGEG